MSRHDPAKKFVYLSRITGGDLLPGADRHAAWPRRFYDLNKLHLNDLGGNDNCSEAERSLVRRSATLGVELERLELKFATSDATITDLDLYQRMNNTLRRNFESLGLKRRAVDVTDEIEALMGRKAERPSAKPDDIDVIDQ